MRLQKFIALSGVASRRKAEEFIKLGRVKVNGETVKEMGIRVDPEVDQVSFDNKTISISDNMVYILLNKPEGYVTTSSDQFNRPAVLDLVKGISERIYPVGRLDYNTSGLLLLTNDGELTQKITHPKSHISKTYICKIKGIITNEEMDNFKKGVDIGGYVTAPGKIKLIKKYKNNCSVRITIHEGKNRQIRRMMDALGHPVIKLERVSIGKIHIEDLEKGKWRYLTKDEKKYLKSL